MNEGGGAVGTIIYLILIIAVIAGLWKIFEKAGKPGWAAIIPIYNIIVLLQIVGKPVWWIILFIIPIVNFIIAILVYLELLKKFSKPGWHVFLIIFLPFIYIPYPGFGDSTYKA